MASISQRPLSPTLSETTTRASEFEFGGKVITRADLRTSIQTYEQVCIPLLRFFQLVKQLKLKSIEAPIRFCFRHFCLERMTENFQLHPHSKPGLQRSITLPLISHRNVCRRNSRVCKVSSLSYTL